MTEKKAKKTIKLRDLEPTKDARGGIHHRVLASRRLLHVREGPEGTGPARGGYGIHLRSNKGITVRKSHRGSIPAVRSLFTRRPADSERVPSTSPACC